MGLTKLWAACREAKAPKLHGVKSEACAPLVRGAAIGRPAPVVRQPSIADGIRIPEPTRAERSYAAVRYSGGRWIAVLDEAMERAWRQAATVGMLLEPALAPAIVGARTRPRPPGTVP